MAAHSSILAWRIPRTEEPGGLWSMGSQRVGHDWVTNTCALTEDQCSERWIHVSWGLTGLHSICLSLLENLLPRKSAMVFFFVNEERRQQTILPIYQMKVVGTKWVPSSLSHSEPQKVIWGTVLILPRGYLISFHVHGRGAHLSHTWDALQQWGLLSHGHGRPCQRVARLELSWEWYEVDCEVRRQ